MSHKNIKINKLKISIKIIKMDHLKKNTWEGMVLNTSVLF